MKVQKSRKRRSKPIKKNTWRRDFKAWRLRLDRRQRLRDTMPDHDESSRVCSNCGQEYVGRYCPQCGQSGVWNRYTFRQVVLNFLDIWGLGNRPMFRTLHDLFWRPGYMVRDYLNGHRQFYFPPFKLFALTVVMLMFANFLTGEGEYESIVGSLVNAAGLDSMNLSPMLATLAHGVVLFARFLASNPLYDMLFVGVCMVCCLYASFRRLGPYNIVETFIFLIFVLIQYNLCSIFEILASGLYSAAGAWVMSSGMVASSPVLDAIAGAVGRSVAVVSLSCGILVLLLLIYDFMQFYGLSFKTTIWRLALAALYGLLAVVVLVVLVVLTRRYGYKWAIIYALGVELFVLVNYVVKRFLRSNRPLLNKAVIRLSRVSLTFCILCSPIVTAVCAGNGSGGHNVTRATLALLACAIISSAVSLLPPFLYKKYRRTWLSLLPPLAFVALLMALMLLSH